MNLAGSIDTIELVVVQANLPLYGKLMQSYDALTVRISGIRWTIEVKSTYWTTPTGSVSWDLGTAQ